MTGTIKINLVCCTQVLLQDIGSKEAKRKDVALTYAMAMKSEAQGPDQPDWAVVNKAIINRWSRSGLDWIKKRAWDIAEGRIKL